MGTIERVDTIAVLACGVKCVPCEQGCISIFWQAQAAFCQITQAHVTRVVLNFVMCYLPQAGILPVSPVLMPYRHLVKRIQFS